MLESTENVEVRLTLAVARRILGHWANPDQEKRVELMRELPRMLRGIPPAGPDGLVPGNDELAAALVKGAGRHPFLWNICYKVALEIQRDDGAYMPPALAEWWMAQMALFEPWVESYFRVRPRLPGGKRGAPGFRYRNEQLRLLAESLCDAGLETKAEIAHALAEAAEAAGVKKLSATAILKVIQ